MSASSASRRCTRRFQRRPRRTFPAPGWCAPLPRKKPRLPPLRKSNQENIRRGLRLVQLMGMLWPTLEFVLGLALAITLLVGGHEVLSHRISIGDFVAFNTYMVMLTWPVIALGWVVNLWQRGTASVVRIDELLSDKPTIDDAVADPSIPAGPDSARRHRVSQPGLFLFRLRLGPRGSAALALAQNSGREQSRHRGADRLGQIDPGQSDPAALRRRRREAS